MAVNFVAFTGTFRIMSEYASNRYVTIVVVLQAAFSSGKRVKILHKWGIIETRERSCTVASRGSAAFRSRRRADQSTTDRSCPGQSIVDRRDERRSVRETIRARSAGCLHLYSRAHPS